MRRLKKNFLAPGTSIALAALLALQACPGSAVEGGDETVTVDMSAGSLETEAQAPVAVQGLRVYRDPQTGRLGPPPPGADPLKLKAAERRMLSRSDRGLRPRALPGGGVAVNLRGRYRNMAVATVDADGQTAVNCALTPTEAAATLQAGHQTADGPAD